MIVFAALMLAATARCAAADACPSDEALKQAIGEQLSNADWAGMQAANAADPSELVLVMRPRLLRIADVYCDEPDEKQAVRCALRLDYVTGSSHEIVALAQEAGDWVVKERHSVWQAKSGRR